MVLVSLLRTRWSFSPRAALLSGLLLQIPAYFLFGQLVYARVAPYARVKNSIDRLNLRDAVVFMKAAEGFKAYDFNQNEADWKSAPVFYMVDPGPDRRAAIAALLHRDRWVVASFDPDTLSPIVEH